MNEPWAGASKSKIEVAISSVNTILQEIVLLPLGDDYCPKNVLDISVMGYSANHLGELTIEPILQGALSGRVLVDIAEIFDHPHQIVRECRTVPDGYGGITSLTISQPRWCKAPDPETMRGSPICAALNHVSQIAQDWASSHRESYPPLVIHLTDGESTDGDPASAAAALKSIATEDGELLLFHSLFLSSQATLPQLPTRENQVPHPLAAKFFRLSSSLPLDSVVDCRRMPSHERMLILRKPRPRGLMMNSRPVDFVRIFKVGTEHFPHWTLDEDELESSEHASPSFIDAESEPSSPRCPCCDRKTQGRPGQRFCIVCEHLF